MVDTPEPPRTPNVNPSLRLAFAKNRFNLSPEPARECRIIPIRPTTIAQCFPHTNLPDHPVHQHPYIVTEMGL